MTISFQLMNDIYVCMYVCMVCPVVVGPLGPGHFRAAASQYSQEPQELVADVIVGLDREAVSGLPALSSFSSGPVCCDLFDPYGRLDCVGGP